MSTIEIHEPEVKEIKPAFRGSAAVLPRTELVLGPALPPRPMFSEDLPKAQLLTFLMAPPPPPPPPPPAAAAEVKVVRQIQTDMLTSGQLRTPTKIPTKVQMIKEEE